MILVLLFLSACTPEQGQIAKGLIKGYRCANFEGYLCSSPDDCALPYLEVIESYCCPIPCKTCNQSCDDNDNCTIDYCSKETDYECKYERIICCGIDCDDGDPCTEDYCVNDECEHKIIKPCPNDGICEECEYGGPMNSCNNGIVTMERVVCSFDLEIENYDCPETCDDGKGNTADRYDFNKQRCVHEECEIVDIEEELLLEKKLILNV